MCVDTKCNVKRKFRPVGVYALTSSVATCDHCMFSWHGHKVQRKNMPCGSVWGDKIIDVKSCLVSVLRPVFTPYTGILRYLVRLKTNSCIVRGDHNVQSAHVLFEVGTVGLK